MMDVNMQSGTLPALTTFGVSDMETVPSSGSHCQMESEDTVLLQLLEFKTHLLEVVEELHIRRDAETRFENQVGKLVLEKQELEWEKESLQHQVETLTKQHAESLAAAKKQFQVKLQLIEEEKGKHETTAKLRDKEIANLREELKSLQLLKYNLEKKSSELEQKLALQSKTKDTHLNQLGEVEKRFGALSRQCVMVKKAHEQLNQNADEAMKINRKLTFANQKQEATIKSLQQELDEVNNKLIKVKMTSAGHVQSPSVMHRHQQHVQELQRKLSTEMAMNKKLEEENSIERAEKQELLKSLQDTQELLLKQTQTVRKMETELKTQTDMHQALRRRYEATQEQSRVMEGRLARVTESYAASKTNWEKEKTVFLEQIESDERDREALKGAFEDLHQRHSELSMKSCPQSTEKLQMSATLCEDTTGGETHSSEQPEPVDPHPENSNRDTVVSAPTNAGEVFKSDRTQLQSLNDSLEESADPGLSGDTSGAVGVSNMRGEDQMSLSLILNDPPDEGVTAFAFQDDTATTQANEENDQETQNKEEKERNHAENGGERENKSSDGLKVKEKDGLIHKQVVHKGSAPELKDELSGSERKGNDGADYEEIEVVQPKERTETQTNMDATENIVAVKSKDIPSADATANHTEASKQQETEVAEEEGAAPVDNVQVQEELPLSQPLFEDPPAQSNPPGPALEESLEEPPVDKIDFPVSDLTSTSSSKLAPISLPSPFGTSEMPIESCDRSETNAALRQASDLWVGEEFAAKLDTREGSVGPVESLDPAAQHAGVKVLGSETCSPAKTVPAADDHTQVQHDGGTERLEEQETNEQARAGDAEKEVRAGRLSKGDKSVSRDCVFVPCTKTFKPIFDWSGSQRKPWASREGTAAPHQLAQGARMSAPSVMGAAGIQAHQPIPASLFMRSRQSKASPMMTRASDLCTSVTRQPLEGTEESRGDAAAAPKVEGETPPLGVSSASGTPRSVGSQSAADRAPASAAARCLELSFSQESENQQTTLRAQISKIEKFLSAERLRVPKRRRNED